MTTLYQWRVYCTTDQKYETVWSETQPSSCPANPIEHVIDASQTSIVQTIDDNIVTIQEELISTQGLFTAKGYKYEIPASVAGDVTIINLTWKRPITLLNGDFDAVLGNVGDVINAFAVPISPIGYITAQVAPGATVIHVSPTVKEYIYMGFLVTLTDGVQTQEMGECMAIDKVNNTITVETPSAFSFSPSSPTYVKITARVVENLNISTARTYDFARKKMGGKSLQSGVAFSIAYKNNNGLAKPFTFLLEYMY